MHCWAKNAYITLLIIAVVWVASLIWIHQTTAASYRAVGINDGKILQSTETMQLILKTVSVPDCHEVENIESYVEVISVKANALHMTGENGSIRFCQY